MTKEYICICGKVFDNPQKFNGHKQGCKHHIINKYGSLERYYMIKNRNSHLAGKTLRETKAKERQMRLQIWIDQKHTCKSCGAVMTKLYASGQYCSRKCANQ